MAPPALRIELPQTLPVFPLDGALLLPGAELPLRIFEPRYLNMLDDVMGGERMIGMVQTTGGDKARPSLARIGCAGRVTRFRDGAEGDYLIALTGVCRFRIIDELDRTTPYRQVRADFTPFTDDLKPGRRVGGDRTRLARALRAYLNRRELDIDDTALNAAPLDELVAGLSMSLPFSPAEKQALLEAPDRADRQDVLTALLEMDALGDDDGTPETLQ
ncbi:LON peptidase substrate-binding domain-containing protein [Phenylobacterium sp.]|jgi:Lon protease-like protein|uniref:LON peptidase substrate-binding domain-containing protein n=1 Tax=Phenylobacterium sp. TaxID=1871053 RepID=UPI0025F58D78|nr:LON peptidase substrate-binding domain-containing protein [Phenylobacterium sp.]MCA3722027.1 LON peptidase substrate-binding domain-containing protein [Phenylobacterium sp.]